MSDDLVTWLRAQLDDNERVARAAAAFPFDHPSDAPWERERLIAERMGGKSRAMATHLIVARFAEPARVLAEVDAKRRILELAWHNFGEPGDAYDDGYRSGLEDAKQAYLKLLALPYADRPGYRDEWRP